MSRPVVPALFQSARSRSSGSALLIILGCVVLLTLLIVAFLITVRTEYSASNFYLKGVTTKLLSENAINLAMTQIREGGRSIDIASGNSVAWASQPGMIRTYDNTGKPYKFFKLYSWDNMDGTGAFDETLAANQPDANWASEPGIFTDINEPVNGIYPIVDPSAAGTVEGFSYTTPTQSGATPSSNVVPMPVKWLYVMKDGTMQVGTPTGTGTAVKVTGANASNPIIGRIAFWTDDETCKVNINTASEGTYWDIPIANNLEDLGQVSGNNMASPWGYSDSYPGGQEFQRVPGHPATTCLSTVFGYGTSPVLPVTSASTVTWPLTAGTSGTYATIFAPYYGLTPRYSAGGSQGGTVPAVSYSTPAYRLYDSIDELVFDPTRTAISSAASGSPVLYPMALPNTGRSTVATTSTLSGVLERSRFFITAHSRAPEETLFGTPRISLWPLQAVTAAQLTAGTAARNAKDNLLAFCSTIAGYPYYFQRATFYQYQATSSSGVSTVTNPDSSQSATQDFPGTPNSTVLTAGTASTPPPGVARNQNLYAYLQALTSANIPGFGGNFLAKYPGSGTGATDRDQNLTDMFDFIRSGINTYNNAGPYPHYTYTEVGASSTGNPPGFGSTVPIQITTSSGATRGLGRNFSVGGLTLVFMAASDSGGLTGGSPAIALANVAAGTADSANPTTRKSIGVGMPWAVVVDNPNTSTNLQPGQFSTTFGDPQTIQMQAFAIVQPYNVMEGPPPDCANVRIRVTNLDQLKVNTGSGSAQSLGFPSSSGAIANFNDVGPVQGGFSSLTISGLQVPWTTNTLGTNDGTNTSNHNYPLYGTPVPLSHAAYPSPYGGQDGTAGTVYQIHKLAAGSTFTLNPSGPVTLKIEVLDNVNSIGTAQVIQTVYVNIPTLTLPVPTVEMAKASGLSEESEAFGQVGSRVGVASAGTTISYYYQLPYDPTIINNRFALASTSGVGALYDYTRVINRGDVVRSFVPNPNSQVAGDMRLLAAMPTPATNQTTWPGDTGNDLFTSLGTSIGSSGIAQYLDPLVKQLHCLFWDEGNWRAIMTLIPTSSTVLGATPISNVAGVNPSNGIFNPSTNATVPTNGALFQGEVWGGAGSTPVVTPELNGAFMDNASAQPANWPFTGTQSVPGDWTNGMGPSGDGPFVFKTDEGYQNNGTSAFSVPYFATTLAGNQGNSLTATSFSPNREVPSPIIFGTLPSRVLQGVPWCTFLFCPNPAANDNGKSTVGLIHPGFGAGSGTPGPGDFPPYTTPPDHLWLDLFWMPVVEPYAISEPFSTAGKVNLNYEMVPFGNYISRSTAVHAVLKSTRVIAIPTNGENGANVKANGFYNKEMSAFNYRYNVNLPMTIDDSNSGFQQRFKVQKDIFRSASEICNIFLVPQTIPGYTYNTTANAAAGTMPANASYANMQTWWTNFKLTGDNSRESPYNQIYPRLTTKSNSFQVNMRVQVITQTPADAQSGTFNLATGDSISGEYRGSAIVERYLDPNQTAANGATNPLPDFATSFPSSPTTTVDAYCHYRIVSTHAFTP